MLIFSSTFLIFQFLILWFGELQFKIGDTKLSCALQCSEFAKFCFIARFHMSSTSTYFHFSHAAFWAAVFLCVRLNIYSVCFLALSA